METDAPRPSIRSEILSAYIASGARVLSWAIVSAMLIRIDRGAFAVFAVIRGTLGFLNYTSLGLGPATVRMLAECKREEAAASGAVVQPQVDMQRVEPAAGAPVVLDYATPRNDPPAEEIPVTTPVIIFANARFLTHWMMALALLIIIALAITARDWSGDTSWENLPALVTLFGIGTTIRLATEPHSAVLQVYRRLRLDNLYITIAEGTWAVLTVGLIVWTKAGHLPLAALAWLLSSVLLAGTRAWAVHTSLMVENGSVHVETAMRAATSWVRERWAIRKQLFSTGATITLGQLADFLYAPVALLIITHLLKSEAVAIYAPTLQIDAALLLIAGGIASVLLPRTALAHAAGEWERVRRYYVRGTLISGGLLLAAALLVWALSPILLPLWLGDHPHVGKTAALLPFVLIHTVIGGSSAVGRSVLLGMGKQRAFTATALIAGVLNVVLCYTLVRYAGMGLMGIVLGTIIAVTLRCAVWMPWYTMRSLRRTGGTEPGTRRD